MTLVNQNFAILNDISEGGVAELQRIEIAGRLCYKSENPDGDFERTKEFVRKIIASGHESVLEHSSLSVIFRTDRGVTHELVRHRLASYSQESTRYCNYSKSKFGKELTFIHPVNLHEKDPGWSEFISACVNAEYFYMQMIEAGCSPELARAVLPNAIKTEICVTANYREWRHILKLRTGKRAHPQIRDLMTDLLVTLKHHIPVIFDDIWPYTETSNA